MQGLKQGVKGTNTMTFIHKHEIPQERHKDVTYICFVCSVQTEKKEPNRTCATIGGNLINDPDDVGTPTTDLLLIKSFSTVLYQHQRHNSQMQTPQTFTL